MKHTQTSGFSLIIALGFMILMSSVALYLLEYMIPFSRNVKGIENASKAYYQSYAGIEDSLLYAFSGWIWAEPSSTISGLVDFWYRTDSNGILVPEPGVWSSELDADWNRISLSEPIQLSIWDGRLSFWAIRIRLRLDVPDFDRDGSPDSLDITPDDDMFLWQLSSATESISTRDGNFINESDIDGTDISLWTWWYSAWVTLDRVNTTFPAFYNTNCGVWNECVFKLSLINPIIANAWNSLPYLHYQVETTGDIPTRFKQIISFGQSLNFKKELQISVLQQNTNAAFDFAIFQ